MGKQPTDAGLVTPAGYKLPRGAPAGLLAEMVGTQENESGGNYYQEQHGYSEHLDSPPSASSPEQPQEGYGAYQFTGQNDMAVQAEAHNWNPWWQDKIAADQMTAYFNQFGSWQAVSEAWAAGPGGVGNPSYGNVDYADTQALRAGDVSHVPNFSYSGVAGEGVSAPIEYSGGLTRGQVQAELKSGSSGTAEGSSGPGGLSGPAPKGSQGTAGTGAAPWGGAFGSQIEEVVFFLLGAALVIVGLVIMFKGTPEGQAAESGAKDTAVAAP